MRKSFTLIEILIVIGIIGVLAALLLGVAGKVTRSAGNLQCVARLRDLGVMQTAYLKRTKGVSKISDLNELKKSWFYEFTTAGVLKHTIADIGVCPTYLAFRYPSFQQSTKPLLEQTEPNVGETYGMPVGEINTKRLREEKSRDPLPAAKMIFIAESFCENSPKEMRWNLTPSGDGKSAAVALMHGDAQDPKGNVWFLDGHVETLGKDDFAAKNLLLPIQKKGAPVPDQATKLEKIIVPNENFDDVGETIIPEYTSN